MLAGFFGALIALIDVFTLFKAEVADDLALIEIKIYVLQDALPAVNGVVIKDIRGEKEIALPVFEVFVLLAGGDGDIAIDALPDWGL